MKQTVSNRLLATALIIFMALNLMLIFRLSGKKTPDPGNSDIHKMREEILLTNTFFMMESEGAAMDPEMKLEAESGEIFCLAEILSGKPLLFLRYSELDCHVCIDHSLNYLKALADSIGHENVAILTSYSNPRNVAVFRRINRIPFTIYKIDDNALGIPAERIGTPYLFVTDNTLIARYIHIPRKELPRMNRLFLSVIPGHFSRMIRAAAIINEGQ